MASGVGRYYTESAPAKTYIEAVTDFLSEYGPGKKDSDPIEDIKYITAADLKKKFSGISGFTKTAFTAELTKKLDAGFGSVVIDTSSVGTSSVVTSSGGSSGESTAETGSNISQPAVFALPVEVAPQAQLQVVAVPSPVELVPDAAERNQMLNLGANIFGEVINEAPSAEQSEARSILNSFLDASTKKSVAFASKTWLYSKFLYDYVKVQLKKKQTFVDAVLTGKITPDNIRQFYKPSPTTFEILNNSEKYPKGSQIYKLAENDIDAAIAALVAQIDLIRAYSAIGEWSGKLSVKQMSGNLNIGSELLAYKAACYAFARAAFVWVVLYRNKYVHSGNLTTFLVGSGATGSSGSALIREPSMARAPTRVPFLSVPSLTGRSMIMVPKLWMLTINTILQEVLDRTPEEEDYIGDDFTPTIREIKAAMQPIRGSEIPNIKVGASEVLNRIYSKYGRKSPLVSTVLKNAEDRRPFTSTGISGGFGTLPKKRGFSELAATVYYPNVVEGKSVSPNELKRRVYPHGEPEERKGPFAHVTGMIEAPQTTPFQNALKYLNSKLPSGEMVKLVTAGGVGVALDTLQNIASKYIEGKEYVIDAVGNVYNRAGDKIYTLLDKVGGTIDFSTIVPQEGLGNWGGNVAKRQKTQEGGYYKSRRYHTRRAAKRHSRRNRIVYRKKKQTRVMCKRITRRR